MLESPSNLPLLEMKDISKEFPGVRALDKVSFSVLPNEIHALVGENGAGKSTLMKILGGVYPHGQYSGKIFQNGEESVFKNVLDSEKAGISVIHQELALVNYLSAAENIYLGDEPSQFGLIDWNFIYGSSQSLVDKYGFNIDVKEEVSNLGIGEQQLVEIAKALRKKSSILVLDEPTAALSETETELLFSIMKKLRDSGTAMIYISHKLDEVFQIADRVTVLRDGKSIATDDVNNLNKHDLIKYMVGRELTDMYPRIKSSPGKVVLEVKNLTVEDPVIKGRLILDDVSFSAKEGEVLGISGLMGAGRSELLLSIFGDPPGMMKSGEIFLENKKSKLKYPPDAIRSGIALVPEDRKNMGLVLGLPILENLSMVKLDYFENKGFIDTHKEYKECKEIFDQLSIRAVSLNVLSETLSGGNQQKIVLGKWLLNKPKILFLDEPTRGIDVGAKVEIYQLINELKKQGVCIIAVSSELPEILGICDRIIVLRRGKISGEFSGEEATQEKIMEIAT